MTVTPHSTHNDFGLQKYFGFDHFRPGQLEALQYLLAGKHTLVVMPTGSGKSLVFQLAALHIPGVTLVISPLLALMKDQVDSLERRGIAATFINSSLNGFEQNRRLQDLKTGKYRLVYIAPERLRNKEFLQAIQGLRISLLVVDEAHCISEWGHDFRPHYLHIAQFRSLTHQPLTAALTATATPQVQDDIARLLNLGQFQRVVTGFNRPNVLFEVKKVSSEHSRLKALQELVDRRAQGAIIIYTGTRRDAEDVTEFVHSSTNMAAEFYHAGLDSGERTRIQDEFMSGKLALVAATNAFGMGIDRSDVRQVIHYSLPGSLEAYYQEAGRAGRDGLPARATLLYSAGDRSLQDYFIRSSQVSSSDLRQLYQTLEPYSKKLQPIARTEVRALTGLDEIKLRVALAELERAGMLEYLGDEGMRFRVKVKGWKEASLTGITQKLQQRQAQRSAQLEKMVAYAESAACRRGIILQHFGDLGPARAQACCDNCVPQPPARKEYVRKEPVIPGSDNRIRQVILECALALPGKLPRSGIAKLLVGSDSQRVGYLRATSFFNRLPGFSRSEILAQVDQLLADGQLAQDQHGHIIPGQVRNFR